MLTRNRLVLATLSLAILLAHQSRSVSAQPSMAWKTLFDGKSLDAWRGYKTATVPDGWRVENGILTKASERWKHLRQAKRLFWKGERRAASREAQNEALSRAQQPPRGSRDSI